MYAALRHSSGRVMRQSGRSAGPSSWNPRGCPITAGHDHRGPARRRAGGARRRSAGASRAVAGRRARHRTADRFGPRRCRCSTQYADREVCRRRSLSDRGSLRAAQRCQADLRVARSRLERPRSGLASLLYDPFILRYKDDPRLAAFCRKVRLPVPGKLPRASQADASLGSLATSCKANGDLGNSERRRVNFELCESDLMGGAGALPPKQPRPKLTEAPQHDPRITRVKRS
jgi:hypothetical protein